MTYAELLVERAELIESLYQARVLLIRAKFFLVDSPGADRLIDEIIATLAPPLTIEPSQDTAAFRSQRLAERYRCNG